MYLRISRIQISQFRDFDGLILFPSETKQNTARKKFGSNNEFPPIVWY